MLVVHPVIQFCAILFALYVFYLGAQRFRTLHLRQKAVFRWKRHVVLGEIALGLLLGGMIGGITTVYVYWQGFLITGTHGKVALVMAPLVIFGLASGLYMHRKKRERKLLPLVHGLNNLAVLILGVTQIVTGWWVYGAFVLGE